MLSDWMDRAWTDVEAGVARALGFVPNEVVEAFVDMAAMIASADGTRDRPYERIEASELDHLLRGLGRLRRSQLQQAQARFKRMAAELSYDHETTKRAIVARMQRIADTPDEARLVMRMAHELAMADGAEDAAEMAVLRQIGDALGVDPACCRPAA